MTYAVSITSQGQISIPAKFRKQLGLDKGKKACEQLLNRAKRNEIRFCVAQATIFEMDFILRKYYLYKKSIVIKQLKPLVATKYIDVESRDIFSRALIMYEKEDISFVDSFLLSKAGIEKAELFTFDQQLQKLQIV